MTWRLRFGDDSKINTDNQKGWSEAFGFGLSWYLSFCIELLLIQFCIYKVWNRGFQNGWDFCLLYFGISLWRIPTWIVWESCKMGFFIFIGVIDSSIARKKFFWRLEGLMNYVEMYNIETSNVFENFFIKKVSQPLRILRRYFIKNFLFVKFSKN